MDDLMDLDQIVDGEGWQLSMDSIGEYSNSSRLSLGAEALRVFEDEEDGWRTAPPSLPPFLPPATPLSCSHSFSPSRSAFFFFRDHLHHGITRCRVYALYKQCQHTAPRGPGPAFGAWRAHSRHEHVCG